MACRENVQTVRVRRGGLRAERALLIAGYILIAGLALLAAGCVDAMLPPRAHDINQSTQNVRESAILLNLVRAAAPNRSNSSRCRSSPARARRISTNRCWTTIFASSAPAINVSIGGASNTSLGGGVGNLRRRDIGEPGLLRRLHVAARPGEPQPADECRPEPGDCIPFRAARRAGGQPAGRAVPARKQA